MRTAFILTLALAACTSPTGAPVKRATLRPVSAATFELVPATGQLPFCLAYTVSPKGVIRQLTMSAENASLECPAGQPIGQHVFRVPPSEPSVRVLVLFTSQSVNATSVSSQLIDTPRAASLTAMDLRLPGQAALELIDFTPEGGP